MPPLGTKEALEEYLNNVFIRAGGSLDKSGNPIVEVQLKGSEALVEWRSIEEAVASLKMNGINFVAALHAGRQAARDEAHLHHAQPAQRAGHPACAGAQRGVPEARARGADVPVGGEQSNTSYLSHQLRLTNLPKSICEDELAAGLRRFGYTQLTRELRELYLLRDSSFESKGIAFCRFESNSETNAALTAKFKLKNQLVTIKRVANPELPQPRHRKSASSSSSSSSSSHRSSSQEMSEPNSSKSSPHPPGPTSATILVGLRRVTISLTEKGRRR